MTERGVCGESLSGSAQLDVLKASEIRQAAKSGHAKSSL
ncbi:uncharacterized protein PITG_05139 [Phytophthora infestans T30-4]|uniref:Uncharacterized protein n=1 Tax=Phytophthora infestans (strain T30-4) TaxID=403677 RepID=D0N3M9_PHYIT|nr:uncharacterized protein PITG_05139 [Phytophthora infestans T30-4]EEY68983.1 hypothetical protein PITG_05139 [Phytophthora infestans T30-4]|eukprot:XP_002998837.1 hypothetical protein PITG_05139 [Phytophthora infestans T30-4]